MRRRKYPWPDRLIRRLMFCSPTSMPTGCIEFTGSKAQGGYGHLRNPDGPGLVVAHRASYELLVGPIPDGLVIDHLCRNTACVNPGHLEPVTTRTNVVVRGTGPTAINARKSHCPLGHPLDAENTYKRPNGRRECRTCKREAKRAARRKAS